MSTTFDAGTVHAQMELGRANFNRDMRVVKKDLADLERSVYQPKVGLNVANFNREYLRVQQKMTQLSNRSIAPSIKLTIDTDKAWRDYLTFRARVAGQPAVVIDLDIETGRAEAAIARIRSRLSGLNADADSNGNAFSRMFGKLMPGLGMATTGLKALSGAAALPGIAQLAVTVGQAAGALATLLPGAIAVAGAAVATLAVGFHGLGDAIKETDPKKFAAAMAKLAPAARDVVSSIRAMGDEWKALRLDVQQQMFLGLGAVIDQLGKAYLPVLREGLKQNAIEFNSLFKSMGAVLLQAQSLKDVGTIMDNASAATKASIPGWTALVTALRDIAAVGADFLPGFAQGWSDALTSFSRFIAAARESGALHDFIQAGLDVLSKLRDVLIEVGIIVYEVFSTASQAGGSFLDTLLLLVTNVRVFLQSAAGTEMLVTLFQTLHQVAAALAPALGVILTAIGQIVVAVAPALVPIAQAISGLVSAIAPLIPIVAEIVSFLGTYLAEAVIALLPLVQALAAVVGDVLMAAFDALKPVFPILIDAIRGLVPILSDFARIVGDALIIALNAVAPILPIVAKALGDILIAVAPLLPALAEVAKTLISALAPALGPIIGAIAQLVTAIAPLVTQLVVAIAPILPKVAELFVALLDAIMPIIPSLLDSLVPAVIDLVKAAVELIVALMPVVGVLIDLVRIVLPPVIDILGFLIGIIADVAGFLIDVLVVAIRIVVDIINFLIDAVKAVGNFFVWLWQEVLVPAWNAIGDVIQGAWDNVIKPVFDFISGVVKDVGDAFNWLWQNVIKPVFDFIGQAAQILLAIVVTIVLTPIILAVKLVGAIFSWLWENAVKPAFQAIGDFVKMIWENVIKPAWDALLVALGAVGDFFVWVWNNVIKPAWDALGTGIKWVYDNIIKPAWDALMAALQAVGDFFVWIWDTIIKPAWDALGAGIQWVYDRVIKPCWDALMIALQAVGDFFSWVWNTIIKPAWDALGEGIKWVQEHVIQPVFDAIGAGLDTVKGWFQSAIDGIKTIWNGLKEATSAPVKFLVETVWNEGILKAWNWVADLLPGVGPADKIVLNFARGGEVFGPGTGTSDDIPAMLSNNEHVWTAEEVQKAGGHGQVKRLRDMAKSGRLAMFSDGGEVQPRLAFAGGGPVWQTLWDTIRGAFPSQARLTSSYRAGDPGYHGKGEAIDVAGPTSMNLPIMLRINKWIASNYGNATELIHTQPGATNLWHGSPHTYDAKTQADHRNHVHWAMAGGLDGGGGGLFGGFSMKQLIADTFKAMTDPLLNGMDAVIGKPPPRFLGVPKALGTMARDKLLEYALSIAPADTGPGDPGSMGPGVGPVVDQVRAVANRYGWGSGTQWNALDRLIQKESSWNPNAQNPTSTAYGLFQFLNSTWASVGATKTNNPGLQAEAGLKYVSQRYGNPYEALKFHNANNWYDRGGILKPGITLAMNGTGKDEYVNTGEQLGTLVRRATSNGDIRGREIARISRGGGDGDYIARKVDEMIDALRETGGVNIGSVNTIDTAKELADEINFRVRRARRPGVHR